MLESRTRAPVPGAALARLLARLAGLDPTPPTQSPTELLGDWLEWQRAIALSRALDDAPAAGIPGAARELAGEGGTAGEAADADDRVAAECRDTRAALESAIGDGDRDWTLPLHPRRGEAATRVAAGAAAVLRHCQGLQRDMQAATGRLRGDLRECLARRGTDAARLAASDAVMEGLLAPREHALLAPVVPTLVARFERLHALHGDDGAHAAQAPGAWRAAFRAEARQVLLAELDLRFQPLEALLAALRTQRPDA
jgi:hypothetical protein